MRFPSLAAFVDAVDEQGDILRLPGVDLRLEAGVLAEVFAEQGGPLLLFDELDGLPPGHRVAANVINTPRRFATAMGLPADLHPIDLVRQWRASAKQRAVGIEPELVGAGRVTEVVQTEVDLASIPAPKWHELDGGKYVGTGDIVVTRHPDNGWVNLGTYRACVQGPSELSLWIIASKHGRQIAQLYWERGEACPVAIVFGSDPVTWFAAGRGSTPANTSEYLYAGALHGAPVEVVHTPVHGLPVPAHAEIVVEGLLCDPAHESVQEGPFGEWPGYYAHEGRECVVHLSTMMRARNPILFGAPPARPIGETRGIPTFAATLWDHLERSGISDVVGVWGFCHTLMMVVALRPRFAGHAMQALLAAAGNRTFSSMYCYYVAVDDDIDPSRLEEVVWAMCTRVDPSHDVQVLNGAFTSGLDPRISPARRESGDLVMGRMLIDATKPFAWRDSFPATNRFAPEERRRVMQKWSHLMSTVPVDWNKV